MTQILKSMLLVTGGGSGIGKLMGLKSMQKRASRLIASDINPQSLHELAAVCREQGFEVFTVAVAPAARLFGRIVGRGFKVYTSMDHFAGRRWPEVEVVPEHD